MSDVFPNFMGQSAVRRLLEASLVHPAPAYVFVGPPHLGKRACAEQFAQAMLGIGATMPLKAHPDFILLEPAEGKKQVSVEQVRELRERVSLRPMTAQRVVALIPSADRLNESGTNALLKVLEEPPADAVFLLVAEDIGRLPATVLSRSVKLPFEIVPQAEIVDGLVSRGFSKADAEERARQSHGRPGLAIEPQDGGEDGASFAHALLAAKTLGARLTKVEELSKLCESSEDPSAAWRDALLSAMSGTRECLESQPINAQMLGLALITALRFIGGPISPRVPLEAAAVRMSAASREELERLFPTHVPRAIPLIYNSLVQ